MKVRVQFDAPHAFFKTYTATPIENGDGGAAFYIDGRYPWAVAKVRNQLECYSEYNLNRANNPLSSSCGLSCCIRTRSGDSPCFFNLEDKGDSIRYKAGK